MATNSLTFSETMSGYFALDVCDPIVGAAQARATRSTLSMHANVSIADLDAFIVDPEHRADLDGHIDFSPLGIGLTASTGTFNLFKPTDDPHLTLMVYELAFVHDTQPYYLAGRKLVRDDPGFDLWNDTTTLHTTLHKGGDKTGEVVGAGILTLGVYQLWRLLRSMRVPGASTFFERSWAMMKFGIFFGRQLWKSYVASKFDDQVFHPGNDTALHYDAIVIGSGFGGAITGCRIAEKGLKTCILERGRRWDVNSYPRGPGKDWLWSNSQPQLLNGWVDIRAYPNMAVAQGAGVGGGSLIYANIFVEADPGAFASGWPPEITFDVLKPYYQRTGHMLKVQTVPDNQWPPKMKLLQEAAQAAGFESRFQKMPLAVRFDPDFDFARHDPTDDRHSVYAANEYGIKQGTCVHCGNCDIGCQVSARNTLDLNYIPLAEKHGAEVRPSHLVTRISPLPGSSGYRIDYDRLDTDTKCRIPGYLNARRVILAAGTMGTNELLLRCRDQYRSLPKLSSQLGRGWSSNGDFLTPALYPGRTVAPTVGPTITGAINFLDGHLQGIKFWVQDGGIANIALNYLRELKTLTPWAPLFRTLYDLSKSDQPLAWLMPWFGQSVDAADGVLTLRRSWWPPFRRQLYLSWNIDASRLAVQTLIDTHKRLSAVTGGVPHVPASWNLFKNLVTPHPLGGCRTAVSAEHGVVDHKGEVFGYPGLYVADGSIIPKALGSNPSRTIAALAERIAELIPDKQGN